MAENKYIDELTELTSPERAADWILVEDVSAAETKKIKYGTVCAGSETALTVTSLTLAAGATVSELSTDGTMAGNSDAAVPTEKAVVTYAAGARTMASLTLAAGATVTEFSTDGTMGGNSDTAVPTEKAVVTYATGARTMASLTLAAGATVTELSTDGTLAGDSDTAVPTEKAVKTYVDTGWRYVSRGADSVTSDWLQSALTTDGAYHDLDLSAIVPAGAHSVLLRLRTLDATAGLSLYFRKNGVTNGPVYLTLVNPVASIAAQTTGMVECDANRVIEYGATSTTWTSIQIQVLGWWI